MLNDDPIPLKSGILDEIIQIENDRKKYLIQNKEYDYYYSCKSHSIVQELRRDASCLTHSHDWVPYSLISDTWINNSVNQIHNKISNNHGGCDDEKHRLNYGKILILNSPKKRVTKSLEWEDCLHYDGPCQHFGELNA